VVDRGGTVDKPSPIGTSIRAVFSRMTLLQDGVDAGWLTTGNTDVDALLGPVGPGDLIVVGARTHVGKSTYMRGVAAHMAGAHGSVLLWSGEQDRERCAGAMVSCEAGVSVHKREKSQRDWEALTAASVKLDKLRISIVDKPRITGPALRAAVRLAKRDAESAGTKLAAVFVDYVQIMGTADLPGLERGANRERQISELSKYLKAEIAQGEGVLVMIGAQLNKDMDKRGPDAKPRTADLRESAALEQDADKIILIHNPNALARAAAFRDSGEQQEAPETEVAELIVAKARDGGQLGTARTIFRPQSGRFDMFKA
jgi:replicative DNA helicase